MRSIKLNLLASVAAGALAVAAAIFTPASAETVLDTSKLVRAPGATETFASPATTIYTSPDSVAATAATVTKLLAADGWQTYTDPFGSQVDNPNLSIVTLKKGAQGLSVFVTLAPAQGNATSVSYSAAVIAGEIPFLPDATEIKYAPDRPYLSLVTETPLDDALATFRTDLTARGWAGWSRKENREAANGEDTSEPNETGKFAFFVRDGRRPVMLMVRERQDGRRDVTIEPVPEKLLTLAASGDDSKADTEATAAQRSAAETAAREATEAFDALAGAIMKDVQRATEQAFTEIGKSTQNAATAPAPDEYEPLTEMTGSNVPLPVPVTAREIDFNGARGDLSYETASSVGAVANFYRVTMKRDGWRTERMPISKEAMAVLRFEKDDRSVAVTVIKFGNGSRVSANGSALVVESDTPSGAASKTETDASAPTVELRAEENSGLPVPTPNSLSGTEKTPFRVSVHASVKAPLDAVLAFYRKELDARAWKEQEGATSNAEEAHIAYTTPEGPATLQIVRKSGETFSTLTVRHEQAAREAGLLPSKGKTKLMFGNVLETAAEITVGKKKIKIAPGLGTEKPDGPTIEVAPGKHTYYLRRPGQPPVSDEIEVAAGDIWGLMVGPGGVLALPMY